MDKLNLKALRRAGFVAAHDRLGWVSWVGAAGRILLWEENSVREAFWEHLAGDNYHESHGPLESLAGYLAAL